MEPMTFAILRASFDLVDEVAHGATPVEGQHVGHVLDEERRQAAAAAPARQAQRFEHVGDQTGLRP